MAYRHRRDVRLIDSVHEPTPSAQGALACTVCIIVIKLSMYYVLQALLVWFATSGCKQDLKR